MHSKNQVTRALKGGYTLVEITTGLGVVAVLGMLFLNSLTVINRRSRDSERLSVSADIADAVTKYYRVNEEYPDSNDVQFTGSSLLITRNPNVEFSEDILVSDIFTEHKVSASTTSSNSTRYYYEDYRGGFRLCVILETGVVENFGTIDCPEEF